MYQVNQLLQHVKEEIKDKDELAYFFTHQVRYLYILSEIVKISKNNKLTILDIGCFPYHIGKALELLGHTVYGISSYHEPINNRKISVLNIENEKFPYKSNFFDLVLCNEVIEHLPQSPVIPLKEIYRVTKKNGYLMVTTPNIARSINRVNLLFGKSIMYPISVYFEDDGKGNKIYHRHNREYTLSELEKMFVDTSWKVEKANYFISYTPFRKRITADPVWLFLGKLINYILMIIFPFLKDTLIVIGKKLE